jgi:hypothetical protein
MIDCNLAGSFSGGGKPEGGGPRDLSESFPDIVRSLNIIAKKSEARKRLP